MQAAIRAGYRIKTANSVAAHLLSKCRHPKQNRLTEK
ncbi:hypothetical protein [Kosakonia sp. MH5]